jgi:hypothetical protein
VIGQNYSAIDGLSLRRVSRMTPDGRWVWAWQSEWQLDADATGQDQSEASIVPEEFRRPALVCSVQGCLFSVTTEGTEHWAETIGVPVEGAFCSAHPDAPMVRGYVDDRKVWR